MSTEKFNIIFHDYPESFNISEARRKKYHEKKNQEKFSKKLKAQILAGQVNWMKMKNGKDCLFDIQTQQILCTNPSSAGTPRVAKINGQSIWESGPAGQWYRQKVKEFLHNWYKPAIIRQGFPDELYMPKGYFIQFEYISNRLDSD